MAVKNNVELDVKIKCLEQNMTQVEIGEAIGTTGQYINRIINQRQDAIVNKTFVKMLEALGYDIELVYKKK